MNFNITLVTGKEGLISKSNYAHIKSYSYNIVPNVGDKLSVDDNVFVVQERMLSTDSSNRVVLFGTLC